MKKFIITSVLAFSFMFSGVSFASANTDTSILQNIMNQIEAIRNQLGGLASRSTTTSVSTTQETKAEAPILPTTILRLNTTGPEVEKLQTFLVEQKLLDARYATGTYDANTVAAVRATQSRVGASADGTWGPSTEARVRNSWAPSWGEAGVVKNPTTQSVSNNTIPNKTNSSSSDVCLPSSAPWIKLLSPNGGEVFSEGQQIQVIWASCNMSDRVIGAVLVGPNSENINLTPQNVIPSTTTPLVTTNDGVEYFTLPVSDSQWPNLYGYGQNFKVVLYTGYLQANGQVWFTFPSDISDNLFSIISAPSADLCTSATAPYIKLLTPNSGVINVNEDIGVGWTTCNIPLNYNIAVQLWYYPSIGNPVGIINLIPENGHPILANDGQEVFPALTPSFLQNMFSPSGWGFPLGQYYKIRVLAQHPSPWNQPWYDDFSDNLLIINNITTVTGIYTAE